MIEVRALDTSEAERLLPELADILADCVEGGASIGFMLPFTRHDALGWWPPILAAMARGERTIFGGFVDGHLHGSVQLVTAMPPNQQHRCDIAKMIVHRRARQQGLGAALMRAAEAKARDIGRSLMVLDTISGSPAEGLYRRLGWQTTGIIPDYALYPDGRMGSTTVMWKKV